MLCSLGSNLNVCDVSISSLICSGLMKSLVIRFVGLRILSCISLLDAFGTINGPGIVFVLLSLLMAGVVSTDCCPIDCEYVLLAYDGEPMYVYRCSRGNSNFSLMEGGLCCSSFISTNLFGICGHCVPLWEASCMVSFRGLLKGLFRDFSPPDELKVPLRQVLLRPLCRELIGDETLETAHLIFSALAWINLGRQRAHATTNPSVHSVSVQSAMNSAL